MEEWSSISNTSFAFPCGRAWTSVDDKYKITMVLPNNVKLTTCQAVPYKEEKTMSKTRAAMLSSAPIPCVIEFAISSPLENVCVVAICILPFDREAGN
jgi:hypothetical protein